MTISIEYNGIKLNKSQQKALKKVVEMACPDREQFAGADPANEVVHTIAIESAYKNALWARIKKDIPSLPYGNMLRAIYQTESWLVYIGRRGGVEVHMAPKSMVQFKGQYWCGLFVRKDMSTTGLS